jgi:deoxyhypusine synthase
VKLKKVKDISLKPSHDLVYLLDQMHEAGGFMGRHLAEAARVLHSMVADRACTKFLSFPAAPVATGLRGVIVELVKEGMVDVIITTSGTLDHDIARTFGNYYHGSFNMDDVKLQRMGYHRLGNILVPLKAYGPLIEEKMQPILSSLYSRRIKSPSTEKLCAEIGKWLNHEGSILYSAYRKKVPIFIPGIMDGAVGSQIWLFSESHRDFQIDLIKDQRRLSDIVYSSKKSGALIIGGGISKHHVLWWNLFKGGLDYVCYITTAVEYDGSLSGAHVREAISWGKVKEKANKTTLFADATTALPSIVCYALTKSKL